MFTELESLGCIAQFSPQVLSSILYQRIFAQVNKCTNVILKDYLYRW